MTAIPEAPRAAILWRDMPGADERSRARDASLVELARDGDEAAYARLVDMVLPRLHGLAFRILRDRDAADDAVQETLVTAWRDLRGLRDPARFDAWLHRLLVRACSRERARSNRRAVVDLDAAAGVGSAERGADDLADRDELERAFARLSVEHRAVVVLARYHDLSTREIARLLEIPEGTVASRLHYALRLMRDVIGHARARGARGLDR